MSRSPNERMNLWFVAILVLLSSTLYAQDPSLVLYFSFDDEAVDEAMDHSQHRNNGTIEGDPQPVAGQFGSALMFDATDDQVVVPTNDTLDIETEITLMVWAKPGPNLTADWRNIVGKSPTNVLGQTSFSYSIRSDNSGVVRFSLNLGSWQFVLGPTFEEDTWYNIAGTYDGTQMILYVNGEPTGTTDASGTINITTDPVCIGNIVNAAGASQNEYWSGVLDEVRIWDRALSADEVIRNMSQGRQDLTKPMPFAWRPEPADGVMHEAYWVTLRWSAGDLAVSHDVYLGDNLDDVNNANRDSQLFRGNQATNSYIAGFPGFAYPDGLVPGTTYYWRIDEINEADPNSPWKGPVWSFSITPRTAYEPDPVDGAESVPLNVNLSWKPGFEAKLHTIYFGEGYNDVNSASGGPLLADLTFTPSGPLELAKTYYWRVDEFNPPFTYKGDVWSFRTEGTAANPNPAKGAVDVSPTPILTWTAGNLAASHEVYFGADADAVTNATVASPEYKGTKALGTESYETGKLDLETTYYWRIDEVNSTQAGSPWIGNVWNFTTGDFLVVDDFEAYNDIDPPDPNSNRIFDSWIDGFGTLDNGALVGNDLPPYAEQTIVHDGAQSMIYRYDNTNKTSEATLTLVSPRDWTEEGVMNLSLWFRGASSNAADKMYVALNGTAVVYHDNPAATRKSGWNQWVIDLTAFTGVNLTNVDRITIGIGTKGSPAAGGTGTMYFDDMRLIK